MIDFEEAKKMAGFGIYKAKERPIIFNTEMVKTILEGRKTMTRRVMKGKFAFGVCIQNEKKEIINCPYGKIGDVLWVRETFYSFPILYENGWGDEILYKADYTKKEDLEYPKWKPSIFMPKKYTRIYFEITDIGVEKVQDISIEDVNSEGIACSDCWTVGTPYKDFPHDDRCGCKNLFSNLWNEINKKRGYGWNKNPRVWVIEFEVIQNK